MSQDDEENSEIKIACEINCESHNVGKPYDSIIELILEYSAVTNGEIFHAIISYLMYNDFSILVEEFKTDIRLILEQIFSCTGQNYY